MSPQIVILLALLSAFSRACLNIVDRQQIGRKRLSIIGLNFLNNIFPSILWALFIILFADDAKTLFNSLFSWNVIAFSGLAQLTAYAYSYAFRYLNVNQITLASKFADIFIPFGILWTIGNWNWGNYLFSVTTTLACLPVFFINRFAARVKLAGAAIICLALTIQASFSPVLVHFADSGSSPYSILIFAANVMLWRSLWALLPAVWKYRSWLPAIPVLIFNPLFFIRIFLTLLTQISFIYAVGNPFSVIAWPILNMTGFIAMLLSIIFLHETANKTEIYAIMSISFLVFIRFFTA